jgi:hypothetical protein
MSNKYFSTRKGPYVYCDMCGQACYIWEINKLSTDTGRGELIVCKNDADKIDFGLKPYTVASEKKIPFSKPNHTNLTNGSEPYNIETQGIF